MSGLVEQEHQQDNNGPSDERPTVVELRSHFAVSKVDIPENTLRTVSLGKCINKLLAGAKLVDEGGLSEPGRLEDIQLVSPTHPHGFIVAAELAFAEHLPLVLRPQHFWLMILQAIAVHVNASAEKVRNQWVNHEGKKKLVVVRDGFVMHQPNNWAGVIEGTSDCFLSQIGANTAEGVFDDVVPTFSSSSAVERVSMAITVMDATQKFFEFRVLTRCGIPSVTLEGAYEDWMLIRQRAEALVSQRCTPEFANFWLPKLLPLLDKVMNEYVNGASGKCGDESFWNSICKRGGHHGSGGYTWLNGWINIFFPLLNNGKFNRDCSSFQDYASRDGSSTDVNGFSSGISKAPVIWDYLGKEYHLEFRSGFVGAVQNPETKAISPFLGWFIHFKDSK